MKTTRIISVLLTIFMLCACLCACSGNGQSKVEKLFESKGYDVSIDNQSDYPLLSATKQGTLPNFSYIECADDKAALDLFESDKQIVTGSFDQNSVISEKVAYGENDGVCCKVAVKGSAVIFATYFPEDANEVDGILTDLGFDK